MKLIIAGSRSIQLTRSELDKIFDSTGFKRGDIEEVVSGCASGIDTSAEYWARYYCIPVKYMPADWDSYGKSAGPIRNREMAKYADVALVIHNGSKGSLNMIWQMKKAKKQVFEIVYTEADNG